MKEKKTRDISGFVNVVVFILIVVLVLTVYLAGASKDGLKKTLVKTEEAYVKKAEDINLAKKSAEKEKSQVQKLPYEKFSFRYIYTFDVKGNAKVITFRLALPKDENQKQYISQLSMQPQPTRTYNDGVNTIAEFKFENVGTGKLNVSLSGIAKQRTYDYETAQKINKNPQPESDLSQYLKPSYLIESNDASIIKTAKSLRRNTKKETVDNTYNFVQKNMTYNVGTKLMGAKDVLKIKQGKCMDYSNLMIALLRANNIPARYVVGNMVTEGTTYHAWVEVYYDNYGWVVYDPTVTITPYFKDASGKIHKNMAVVNPSKCREKYIASARNMVSSYKMQYQMSSKARTTVSLSEKTQIKKVP